MEKVDMEKIDAMLSRAVRLEAEALAATDPVERGRKLRMAEAALKLAIRYEDEVRRAQAA